MRVLVLCFVFFFLEIAPASAFVSSCGKLRNIDDYLQKIEAFSPYYDIRPDVLDACGVLDELKLWEKAKPREYTDSTGYKSYIARHVHGIMYAIRDASHKMSIVEEFESAHEAMHIQQEKEKKIAEREARQPPIPKKQKQFDLGDVRKRDYSRIQKEDMFVDEDPVLRNLNKKVVAPAKIMSIKNDLKKLAYHKNELSDFMQNN